MTRRIEELAGQLVRLQAELDREIEHRRKQLGWSMKAGLVAFEHGVVDEQRRFRMSLRSFMARSAFGSIITAPVVYSLIVPLLLVDLWISLYQAICFRGYGIARVRRSQYILLDRRRLAYLNWIEALNCLYCSYGNGVIAYAREVAGRTEQYWCPIKHALRVSDPHQRYYQFLEYGDAEGYRARLAEFRTRLHADDVITE